MLEGDHCFKIRIQSFASFTVSSLFVNWDFVMKVKREGSLAFVQVLSQWYNMLIV